MSTRFGSRTSERTLGGTGDGLKEGIPMATRAAPVESHEPRPARSSRWRVFGALLLVVLVLALVQVPYSASVMAERLKASDLLLGLWLVINTVLLPTALAAIASGVGIWLGDQVGLGAPLLHRWANGDKTARADVISAVLPSA